MAELAVALEQEDEVVEAVAARAAADQRQHRVGGVVGVHRGVHQAHAHPGEADRGAEVVAATVQRDGADERHQQLPERAAGDAQGFAERHEDHVAGLVEEDHGEMEQRRRLRHPAQQDARAPRSRRRRARRGGRTRPGAARPTGRRGGARAARRDPRPDRTGHALRRCRFRLGTHAARHQARAQRRRQQQQQLDAQHRHDRPYSLAASTGASPCFVCARHLMKRIVG